MSLSIMKDLDDIESLTLKLAPGIRLTEKNNETCVSAIPGKVIVGRLHAGATIALTSSRSRNMTIRRTESSTISRRERIRIEIANYYGLLKQKRFRKTMERGQTSHRKAPKLMGGDAKLKKINVLHILTSLGIGGIEKLFVSMADYWSKDKYNVSVCLINSYTKREMVYYEDLMQSHLKVYMIGKKRRGSVDLMMPHNLFRLLKELNIHIVHTHNISSEVYSRIAGMMAQTPIIVFHQHGAPTELQLKVKSLDLLLRKPDKIIAVSHDTKKMLQEELKISQDKIDVVYNGIQESPNDFPVTEGSTIFTVCRLVPEKGLRYLIDAMTSVKEKIPDVKLLIIGDGPSRGELEKQAIKNSLGETVSFVGFQQFPEKNYDKYDIFVLPSLEEGFGLALIEAMSYGKPVIATRTGGIPEIIEDGVNGILVPPKDHKALANALVSLLSDTDLRKRLALEGQRRSQLFTVNKMVCKIEDTYEGLIKQKMNLAYDGKNKYWRHL